MVEFDFVTDPQLRTSLEADFAELEACYEAKAWKSVHVLAGSIIEALLIDHLSSLNSSELSAASLLKKDLESLISSCRDRGILSEKTAQLSTVVRSYRNLIHPGRLVRLNERVDEQSSTIAKALVVMIVREVEATKRRSYGYTAQQIVKKIELDPSVMPILPHLLAGLNHAEIQLLILSVLPDRYFELLQTSAEVDFELLPNLAACFRRALDAAIPETRTAFAKKLVSVVKEGDRMLVEMYESVLFRGSDLEYLDEKEREIVKVHLFEQLKGSPTEGVIRACDGISAFLKTSELRHVFHPCLTAVAHDRPAGVGAAAKSLIDSEFKVMTEEQRGVLKSILEHFMNFYDERNNKAALARLRPFRVTLLGKDLYDEQDIPF